MSLAINALDRLQTVALCLEAVDDLLQPEQDLYAVNRDKFAVLMGFLMDEHRAALEMLAASIK
jgi:hypothetical protein